MDQLQTELYEAQTNIPQIRDLATGLMTTNDGLMSGVQKFVTDKVSIFASVFDSSNSRTKEMNMTRPSVYHKRLVTASRLERVIVEKTNYPEVRHIHIPIIPGSTLYLSDTLSELTKAQQHITLHYGNILDDCESMLAKAITDQDYMVSKRPVKVSSKLSEGIELLKAVQESVIDTSSFEDVAPISVLLHNISSLPVVKAQALGLMDLHDNKKLKRVEAKLAEISTMSSTLYTEFSDRGNTYSKSKVVEVADILQATAEYVTLATSIAYIAQRTTTTVTDIYKVLGKRL